jgi:hypothetical protein
MPYLLMSKCYEYNDEHYYEQEGGEPQLAFADDQELTAYQQLEESRVAGFVSCTPLCAFYEDQGLEELSSSGLDDETLAKTVSTLLGSAFSVNEIRELDFRSLRLTHEQRSQVACLFDIVGDVYLQHVKAFGG